MLPIRKGTVSDNNKRSERGLLLVDQKTKAIGEQSISSLEVVDSSLLPKIQRYLSDRTLAAITEMLDELVPNEFAKIYTELLNKTRNINAQFQGWSVLHYLVFSFSVEVGRLQLSHRGMDDVMRSSAQSLKQVIKDLDKEPSEKLQESDSDHEKPEDIGKRWLDLIATVLDAGADVNLEDLHGRAPFYFAATKNMGNQNVNHINNLYRFLVLYNKENRQPRHKDVYPLHVAASQSNRYVAALLNSEADPGVIDKYGRTPLHCAVINSSWDLTYWNVGALIDLHPNSLEQADQFGCFPLSYAILYGSDNLVVFLLHKSSAYVIGCVLDQLDELLALGDEHLLSDPIYVPILFKMIGGMPKKSRRKHRSKQDVKKTLEFARSVKEISYEREGVTYSIHHDGHGFKKKHVMNQSSYKSAFSKKRSFFQSTKSSPAVFLPEKVSFHNYESLVSRCMKALIDSGADLKPEQISCVDCQETIGGDNGEKTQYIEVYYTGPGIGAHIRPKYLDKIPDDIPVVQIVEAIQGALSEERKENRAPSKPRVKQSIWRRRSSVVR